MSVGAFNARHPSDAEYKTIIEEWTEASRIVERFEAMWSTSPRVTPMSWSSPSFRPYKLARSLAALCHS